MRKLVCAALALMLTASVFAQELKVKNGEVKLDDKTVAYIEGKKQNFKVLSLDKQYSVDAELKFLEQSGKRWMVLKSDKSGKSNEVDYKKFNPLNQQKSAMEAFIDKGFLSAEGLNTEAIENFLNGESTGVSTKIKADANAADDAQRRIAGYKVTIDDSGNIYRVIGQNPDKVRFGNIKIVSTTSLGVQKYEVYDLNNVLTGTWYNMSSKHPGYDKFLYEELITFDNKVFNIKYDSFGNTLQYKMSLDRTALNIVNVLIDNGYLKK